jgi:hypothetical protein
MRILLTGSRDWDDRRAIYDALERIVSDHALHYEPDEYGNYLPDPDKITVVHGACPTGADEWANQWAISNCDMRLVEQHPADWERYGKRAGPIRNQEMVDLGADLCIAFIRNGSRGATHTAQQAAKAGIPTRVFRYPAPRHEDGTLIAEVE